MSPNLERRILKGFPEDVVFKQRLHVLLQLNLLFSECISYLLLHNKYSDLKHHLLSSQFLWVKNPDVALLLASGCSQGIGWGCSLILRLIWGRICSQAYSHSQWVAGFSSLQWRYIGLEASVPSWMLAGDLPLFLTTWASLQSNSQHGGWFLSEWAGDQDASQSLNVT